MLISLLLIRKIIMQFLFPPGVVVVALLLILILFNRKKLATCFTILLVFFLLVFSSWIGEYFLLRPLEDDYHSLQETLSDDLNLSNPIIVVLGGDVVEDSLSEQGGKTEIGEVSLMRVFGASRIYHEMKCPIVVSGGTVPGSGGKVPSAEVMEKVLLELGIPPGDIMKEIQSRTTYENAESTLENIQQQDYQEIILVTSAVHMRRSVQAFQNHKIAIIPAPVNYLFENIPPGILNILPNGSSWDHNCRALHEWVGLLYYRFFLP